MLVDLKNIIIGTAGHVDHGKTSLIRKLTDIDTDCLIEEKKRGISIDLGFAFFDLPSKRRAGIIDVPGHEKFIKNMLAGVTGIDVVLLVVACDEGIMPQTKEHVDILTMLNVKKGIIVLTKSDLVDEKRYEFVKNEVINEFSDTFLKDSKIIPFSVKNDLGNESLLNEIDNLIDEDENKNDDNIFRMPVDRAFVVKGFGTVVTGTIISGKIKLNDKIVIYPDGIETKIRNIQVYENDCDEAFEGQRCALNLSNIKLEQVKRGVVISKKNLLIPSSIIDCKFYTLKNLDKDILSKQKLRFFHGTSEVIGKIFVLSDDKIMKNSEAYVQFHLEKPIVSLNGDHFVVRTYSPISTVGGGYIINPIAKVVRNNNKYNYVEDIKIRENKFSVEYLDLILREDERLIVSVDDIINKYPLYKTEILYKFENITKIGNVVEFEYESKKYFVHSVNLEKILKNIKTILTNYHEKNVFKIGIPKEELKSKLKIESSNFNRLYDKIVVYFVEQGFVKNLKGFISLADFDIKITDNIQMMINGIIDEYKRNRFIPPKINELKDKFNFEYFFEIHKYLEDIGSLYQINPEMYLYVEDFIFGKNKIVEYINKNGFIELKDVREILNSNRKYSVYFIEHLDSLKITKRDGNVRVLVW